MDNLKFIRAELSVSRKEYITPHYIRIYLTGPDIPLFENTTIGVNNKILIPPKGLNKVYFPEFDYEKKQWQPMRDDVRPAVRTYTHRGIDLESNEIWIDFVAHGDEGPASAWAMAAKEGDVLGVLMKDGKIELFAKAGNYLLIGDATAIPVLGAILEDLPVTANGLCIIEVHSREDVQPLKTKADIRFVWLYNDHPQTGSQLAETVRSQPLPTDNRFAYIAAEYSAVKDIRHYLRKEKGWQQKELYGYSYWKSGVSEDKSVADRRAEKTNG
jgi:NADPH-dependent ferric siderophore reductase